MSKSNGGNWLKRLKKTDPEPEYEPPVWLGNHSNGEYFHEATPKQRLMRDIILKQGAEQARRYGMERREFMASGLGMTLTMSVINLLNGCSSNGKGGGFNPINGMNASTPVAGSAPAPAPSTGVAGMGGASGAGISNLSPGGVSGSEVPSPSQGVMGGAGSTPMAEGTSGLPMGNMSDAGAGMPEDPVECEIALDYTDMFIFDIQTHRVETAPGVYRQFLGILPQARCGLGVPACYSGDEYIRQMFLESDTTMTVLSGIPAVDGQNPLTNEQIAETRDYVNMLASDSERLITHAMVLPNYNHEMQLDGMSRLAEELAPIGSWKCYTPWGPGGGVTGFWLDDPEVGIPFIERGREVGVKVFCCHKGLPLPGFDNNYGDPKDIGVVAARYPDTTFVVYHSAYQYGSANETISYTPGARTGVNSLVTACLDNGLGPGSNVYAELGSTWYNIMTDTTAATHVLGKLLKYIGEDNIVWGTDCMWYGSPQPQISMFMSFQMDERIREREGYPELTMEIKTKILGLNAAKIFNVDPLRKRCGFDAGALAHYKRAADGEFGRFRWAYQRPLMTTRRQFLMHDRLCRALKTPG